jgi:hypothetical protein
MHTLHWWAVEAEDKEEAFGIVKERLLNEDGTNWVDWSDWHVVGGGRWNNIGDGYQDQSNMIVSYKDNPDKFKEILKGCQKARVDEMNNVMSKINTDKFISNMVDYISNNASLNDDTRFDMNSYYIKVACDLMDERYTSNSYFYDYKEYTPRMEYVNERLDKAEGNLLQFLVPVDFHF